MPAGSSVRSTDSFLPSRLSLPFVVWRWEERRGGQEADSPSVGNFSFFSLFIAAAMLPGFPERVSNVTVTVGQNAELRCKVENLNNYKVTGKEEQFADLESGFRKKKGCETDSQKLFDDL